jgi:hypothetical protein
MRKKRLKAFLLGGIAADVEFVEIEVCRKVVNLDARSIDLRPAQILQDLGCGDCGKQAEDHKHDQEFKERKAALNVSFAILDTRSGC